MTHVGAAPDDRSDRFRERHRMQRRQDFVDTARRLITDEGLDVLTMQRITQDLDCAAGSIYRYFPTKSALIAAAQAEALATLEAALAQSQANLEELVRARRVAPPLASLTRVLAAGLFWIRAADRYPGEVALIRQIFTHPRPLLSAEDGATMLGSALQLLATGSELLEDAVRHDRLDPGPNTDRILVVLASTTGVLLAGPLGRWEPVIFDVDRLAEILLWDLLLSWGADPAELTMAEDLVGVLADRDELVPAPECPAGG